MNPKDRVICVNGDFSQYGPRLYRDFEQLPLSGEVYTLREVKFEPENNTYRVLLEEIVNPAIFVDLYQANLEPGFDGRRFRVLEPDAVLEATVQEKAFA